MHFDPNLQVEIVFFIALIKVHSAFSDRVSESISMSVDPFSAVMFSCANILNINV